jgi:hypothetical protein
MQAGAAPCTPAGGWRRPLQTTPRPEGRTLPLAGSVPGSGAGRAICFGWRRICGRGGVRASVVPLGHAAAGLWPVACALACGAVGRHAGTGRAQPAGVGRRARPGLKPVPQLGRPRAAGTARASCLGSRGEAPGAGSGEGAASPPCRRGAGRQRPQKRVGTLPTAGAAAPAKTRGHAPHSRGAGAAAPRKTASSLMSSPYAILQTHGYQQLH